MRTNCMTVKDDTIKLYRLESDEAKSERVVTNGLGHNVWSGTVKAVALEIDSTTLHDRSEAQKRLTALREAGEDFGVIDQDEPLEITEADLGLDPYDNSGSR